MLNAVIDPTTVRLGHNLLAAGRNSEARAVYERVIEMKQAANQPVSKVEAFIKETYDEREAAPGTETIRKRRSSGAIGLVAPAPATTGADKKSRRGTAKSIAPAGIHIEQLHQDDGQIKVIGFADDTKTVAKYMRLIHSNLGEPVVNWVKQEEREQKRVSAFSIRMETRA